MVLKFHISVDDSIFQVFVYPKLQRSWHEESLAWSCIQRIPDNRHYYTSRRRRFGQMWQIRWVDYQGN